MNWVLGAAFIVSFIAFLITRRALKDAVTTISNLSRHAERTQSEDQALILKALAREIANELMQRDAEKYADLFAQLHHKWGRIKTEDEKAKIARLEKITGKYVLFSDFDELGTWSHVLYSDGFSWKGYDDLWDLYESLRLYNALSCELFENWRWHGIGIAEEEHNHLIQYCKRLSDTKLLAHLHRAREKLQFLEGTNASNENDSEWEYETKDYKYKRIPHFAESRWGVYVKSIDRYGMWGLFVDKKAYTRFYAADEDFNEDLLNDLNIRISIDMREYSSIEKEDW